MVDKKIIDEAIEMTKNIPWRDVLGPSLVEEWDNSYEYDVEYLVIMEKTLDKFERRLNEASKQWWYPSWWMTVCQTSIGNTFYILLERGVVLSKEETTPIAHLFDENEPDLYDDIDENVNDWQTEWEVA